MNPEADLGEPPQSDSDLRKLGALPFLLPFHDPNETEEQIGYSDQEVRQRQIVGGVRKDDFVGSVVAVEEIGLLQEALQGEIKRWVRKLTFVFCSSD